MVRDITVTPALADGIINSMLYNGDWNPDVIVVAAQTAQRTRRTITTTEVARQLAELGHIVNDDGTVEWKDE